MRFEEPVLMVLDRVRDLRLPYTSYVNGFNERELGPGATGILSVIGPFLVDRFAAALRCIVTDCRHEFSDATIAVDRVLAQPWKRERTAAAIGLRARGPAPRISVARVVLTGSADFYIVIDGCHRTYAARRAGDLTIEANVQEVWTCEPKAYSLLGTHLLRGGATTGVYVDPSDPMGPEVEIATSIVPYDVAIVLHALGTPGEASTAAPSFW